MRSWQIIVVGMFLMTGLIVGEPSLRAAPGPGDPPCGTMCKKTKYIYACSGTCYVYSATTCEDCNPNVAGAVVASARTTSRIRVNRLQSRLRGPTPRAVPVAAPAVLGSPGWSIPRLLGLANTTVSPPKPSATSSERYCEGAYVHEAPRRVLTHRIARRHRDNGRTHRPHVVSGPARPGCGGPDAVPE